MSKAIFAAIVAVVGFLLFITFVTGWGAVLNREVGQYNEESRRIIQTESYAYQEGMAQNLDKLCLEYDKTKSAAVAASIRHRVSGYTGELPDHVQKCIDEVRSL